MRIADEEKPHGWRDVIASVLAAAIGVQSEKNRQRDFESGNPGRFVVVGIIAVLVFVCVIYLVVQLVIKSTSA
jgi:uncharacterized membrane protein YidH (DUF202 family)